MNLKELKEQAYHNVSHVCDDIVRDMEKVLEDETQDLDFEDVKWAYCLAMEKVTNDIVNQYKWLAAEK